MVRTFAVLITLIAALAAEVGATSQSREVEVEWHGGWYDAAVISRDGDQVLIHYAGYGPEWDEWVGPERIRWPQQSSVAIGQRRVGDAVSVKWGSTWWPAIVVATDSDRALIHYVGWDARWDEWVDASRIR
jgi:RNA binding activity-knot of a chromodomain/Agenet domain